MQGVDSITRPKMIPIDITAAGDNIIIPASDDLIYVRQLLLTAPGGANVIELKNGSEVLSNFGINANDGIVLEMSWFDYPFLFECDPGEDFIINLGTGTNVKGHLVYGYRK